MTISSHGSPPPPRSSPLQVGVVRQVETAAIKKAGDNKSGPFERRMTALHTRATLEVGACPWGAVAVWREDCRAAACGGRTTGQQHAVGGLQGNRMLWAGAAWPAH